MKNHLNIPIVVSLCGLLMGCPKPAQHLSEEAEPTEASQPIQDEYLPIAAPPVTEELPFEATPQEDKIDNQDNLQNKPKQAGKKIPVKDLALGTLAFVGASAVVGGVTCGAYVIAQNMELKKLDNPNHYIAQINRQIAQKGPKGACLRAAKKAGLYPTGIKKIGRFDKKIRQGPGQVEATELFPAVESGNASLVEMWLTNQDSDPNIQDGFGRTPLGIAIQNNDEAIVQLLLAYPKIDINVTSLAQTPLEIAKSKGNPAIIKLLEDYEKNRKK